jgi:hypothetical protein
MKGNIPFTRYVIPAELTIRELSSMPLAMIWFFPFQKKGSDSMGRFCV